MVFNYTEKDLDSIVPMILAVRPTVAILRGPVPLWVGSQIFPQVPVICLNNGKVYMSIERAYPVGTWVSSNDSSCPRHEN